MRLNDAINIEDLHRMAKRRLPKIAFDFIEGGLEDERGLERNTSAFHKHQLLPRYLVDVSVRNQSATLFGHTLFEPVRHLADRRRRPVPPRRRSDAGRGRGQGEHPLHHVRGQQRFDRGGGQGRAQQRLVSALRRARGQDPRGHDPPDRRCRARRPGADRRRAGRLEARAQHPQRLCQCSRRAAAGAEPEAVDPGRGVDPSRLDRRIPPPRRRHADAAELAALCAERRQCRSGLQFLALADAVQRADLARSGDLPPAVSARPRRQGHHEPGRCAARRRDRLRRDHRLQPWRPAARPGAGLARRVAGDQGGGRRQAGRDARQRRPARRRHPDRAVPRREIRLYGPADALRRCRRRHPGGQQGDLDPERRDRPGHGPDRLSRASTSSAPISCGATIGSATSDGTVGRKRLASSCRASVTTRHDDRHRAACFLKDDNKRAGETPFAGVNAS